MRKKRFVRTPITNVQLTENDLYILRSVYQHRFIRSTHICALLKSKAWPLRRLQMLYHGNYLERPRLQISYYKSGSEPMVYSITTKGAKAIGIEKRIEEVDKRPSHHLFQHTLLTTDFLIRVETSCRKQGLTFTRIPIVEWSTKLHYEGRKITRRIIPDAAFSINGNTFFLETDTGHMALSRTKNDHQNSILKKQIVYKEAWRNKSFPFPNLRVIFFTSSNDRKERMTKLHPSPMFLYCSQTEVNTCLNGNMLEIKWKNGINELSPLHI